MAICFENKMKSFFFVDYLKCFVPDAFLNTKINAKGSKRFVCDKKDENMKR